MRRVALVTNLCPHYRRTLFLELGRRLDLTVFLTSRDKEWYWQGGSALNTDGLGTAVAHSPRALAHGLRTGAFDGVIASLTGRASLLTAFRAARVAKLPFILWVGIWEHPRTLAHRLSRPFVRRLYRSADAIVTYGSHVSDFIASESGRVDNVFVAPQSVDNEYFRAPVPQVEIEALRARIGLDHRPIALFVGRLTEEKGLPYLLGASAHAGAGHQVVIAGEGPLLERTREHAGVLGIADRVHFVGQIAQADLPALLHTADLLVLPSISTPQWREPWGLVVNEAMNCALPVITTDAVGAAAGGLVVAEETGLVVPQRDTAALARALDDLVSDEQKRRRLGEAGQARVLEWNYEAAADAFVAALDATKAR